MGKSYACTVDNSSNVNVGNSHQGLASIGTFREKLEQQEQDTDYVLLRTLR